MIACPYCSKPATLVTGSEIYAHRPDLNHKKFWECVKCDAYVGCHSGTEVPYGTLANSELRRLRSVAHSFFDPLWKDTSIKRFKSRKRAYNWLADKLKIKVSDCHIGMFDVDQCGLVISFCEALNAKA